MSNGTIMLAPVAVEPAQRQPALPGGMRGSAAVLEAKQHPTPTDTSSSWSFTLPGAMAGKRPPRGSPRVDFVVEKEAAGSAAPVGAEYTA